MALFREYARPKINLTLRVLGRRADGYHELESLVAFADRPADVVTLDTHGAIGVTVTGPRLDELGGANILDAALGHLAGVDGGLALGGVALEKHLPVAAGIGGGSADAAALLRAVKQANPQFAASLDWARAARALGADVPVCLRGAATMMRGSGELLYPAALPAIAAVLVNPQSAVPPDKTAQVFRRLGAKPLPAGFECDTAVPEFSSREDLVGYVSAHPNDLEPAALHVVPEIPAVLDALRRTSEVLLARMSGAGPTCFGLYPTAEAASRAAVMIRDAQRGWWVEQATLG